MGRHHQQLAPVRRHGNATEGIFAIGFHTAVTTTRDLYTYSSNAVTSATAASAASQGGSATGNSTVGIFALGNNGTTTLTTRDLYTYSSGAVTSGTVASTTSQSGAAAGNSIAGLFALGTITTAASGGVTTRDKYTYIGNVVSSGTAATTASSSGSAASNGCLGIYGPLIPYGSINGFIDGTVGIFALGSTTSAYAGSITTRDKYTYIGNVVTTGTVATVASFAGSAVGNSLDGIFSLGVNVSNVQTSARNKYTYIGDIVTTGTVASTAANSRRRSR